MYCKYCGREVDWDARFCPYCGKRQKWTGRRDREPDTADGSEPADASGSAIHLSRRVILAIALIAAAAVALVIVGFILTNRSAVVIEGDVAVAVQPKLSEENVEAANEILAATDDFLDHTTLRPATARNNIEEIRDSITLPEQSDPAYGITEELISHIEEIEEEIGKGEIGNLASGVSDILSGDRDSFGIDWDALQEYRDQLEAFVEENS